MTNAVLTMRPQCSTALSADTQAVLREVRQIELALQRPVTLGTGRRAMTYSSLTLRAPTRKDAQRAATATPGVDCSIVLMALTAGVPQDVIERLCPRDFMAACNFLATFDEADYGE